MASSYILSSHPPRRFSLQFSNTSNICSILKFSDIGISNRTRRRWEKRLLVDCWSLSHKGHTHTCSRPDTTTTDSHLSLFYFPPFSKWVYNNQSLEESSWSDLATDREHMKISNDGGGDDDTLLVPPTNIFSGCLVPELVFFFEFFTPALVYKEHLSQSSAITD